MCEEENGRVTAAVCGPLRCDATPQPRPATLTGRDWYYKGARTSTQTFADLTRVNSYVLRALALTEPLLDEKLAELDPAGRLRATPRGRELGGALKGA
jgi:hypothetical protein